MIKRQFIGITLISMLFIGCAVKPTLLPVNLYQVDVGKDGKMYFEMVDSHTKMIEANRNNLPGTHHDVNEENYLPMAFTTYLKNNIIDNLRKSPGLEVLLSPEGSDFHIQFNLEHFDVYRETSGGAAAAGILVGGLLGAALMEESCTAELRGTVIVSDSNSGQILCTFKPEIIEKVEFRMNDVKKGYTDATQQAASELVKQILDGLTKC